MGSSADDSFSLSKEDMVWSEIRRDALQMNSEVDEFLLEMGASELFLGFLQSTVFQWHNFEEALAALLASKLGSDVAPKSHWHGILLTAFTKGSSVSGLPLKSLIKQDLMAIKDRDPACPSLAHAFLNFKGYHGIQAHRAANWLWQKGQRSLASLFQSRSSEVFGMDIHPAAQLGSCIMIDHATGVVIGETARVGNGCTLLHGVTLGGNGKQQGDRHPKLGMNVLVGAGASILGNVTVGDGARVGASAVVLREVPPFATAVGCPAKIIGRSKEENPASALEHSHKLVDDLQSLNQKLRRPLQNSDLSIVEADRYTDQLQNVFGLQVPEEEAMPLFVEQTRNIGGKRVRKQPSNRTSRFLQLSVPTCVCPT